MLTDLLHESAAQSPERIAIESTDGTLTRAQLIERVANAAAALSGHGVSVGDLVVLRAARSLDAVVATLASWDLGAAVAPLPAASGPSAALDDQIAAVRPRVILADRDLVLDHPGSLDVADIARAADGPRRPQPSSRCDGLAYVLHTSGTTGRRKLVAISRDTLLNRLTWGQEVYPLSRDDGVLHWTSPVYDFAFWEILAPLCFGARLVIADAGSEVEPQRIARLIRRHGVTCLHFIPSLFSDFFVDALAGELRGLRYLFFGGEQLPASLARRITRLTSARVFNQYGPTEACIDCVAWELRPPLPEDRIPIGHPISGSSSAVLTDDLEPAQEGMLYVGGRPLAWGYLGNGRMTAEAFLPDPNSPVPGGRIYRTGDQVRVRDDGALEFLGRDDEQVKIRGVRVEPADVESVLLQAPSIAQVAVVGAGTPEGRRELVAHLVAASTPPAVDKLRQYLADRLPLAAVPGTFVFHDELPRLESGKVDRRALSKGPSVDRPAVSEDVGPATATERRLAGLWSELLGVGSIRPSDDFFDLGGHSFLALRLIARIRGRFGAEVSPRIVYDSPTLREMATAIQKRLTAPAVRS